MAKEFMTFLKTYGVIGLAIAVVIGGKVNAVVSALVDGVVMPVVGLVTPGGNWRELGFQLQADNPNSLIKIGALLGALLDFLLVAYLVFWFAKRVLKEETVAKK